MIYITGDTHGALEIGKVRKHFKNRQLTHDDYLIILGDVGIYSINPRNDQYVFNVFKELGCTVLLVDGNHDDHQQLANLPIVDFAGGKAHLIHDNIYHLMRGYVFEIDNRRFFAFGGAASIDRAWRTEGIDWRPEELPNQTEYNRGRLSLEKVKGKVDYIITHTAPYDVVAELNVGMCDEERELNYYFQEIAENTQFKKWLFGHFHVDEKVFDQFICVYDKFYKIKPKKN